MKIQREQQPGSTISAPADKPHLPQPYKGLQWVRKCLYAAESLSVLLIVTAYGSCLMQLAGPM